MKRRLALILVAIGASAALLPVGSRAGGPGAPPDDMPPAWAERIVERINQERESEARRAEREPAGITEPPAPLRLSPELSGVAQAHSAYLAGKGTLGTQRADGKPVWHGLERAAPVAFVAPFGHSVFRSPYHAPGRVADIMLENPDVKKTLLGARYGLIGIGVARGVIGDHYWTFLLAKDVAQAPAPAPGGAEGSASPVPP